MAISEAACLLAAASRCESLRPATFLEIAGFCAETKPYLRFVMSEVDSGVFARSAIGLGLVAHTQSVFVRHGANGWSNLSSEPGGEVADLLVIGRDARTREVLNAELSDSIEAGISLGYPECCVRSVFELAEAAEKWPQRLLATVPQGWKVDARLNRFAAELGRIGLLGELFPCSLNCVSAAMYSQRLYDSAIDLGLTRLANAALSDALQPVMLKDDGSIAAVNASHASAIEFVW